jgi:predicted nucleotidyltransferase
MTRQIVRNKLENHLVRCKSVLAMWEAGSAAFDRIDDYSDLDIGILSKKGSNEDVWLVVDRAFEELGGVTLRWNEPSPVFSGMDKRIFRPREAKQWFQVDIGLFPDTATELYNQPERHGRILVVFDHANRMAPPLWDEDANRRRMGEALHQNLMKWQAYYGWFRKELARGRAVDAFVAHLYLTVIPLLTVLNMRYRPNRWDFGFRYLKEELPPDVVKIVERLCYMADPTVMETRFSEADQLLRATLDVLEEQGIRPIDSKGVDIFAPHDSAG